MTAAHNHFCYVSRKPLLNLPWLRWHSLRIVAKAVKTHIHTPQRRLRLFAPTALSQQAASNRRRSQTQGHGNTQNRTGYRNADGDDAW